MVTFNINKQIKDAEELEVLFKEFLDACDIVGCHDYVQLNSTSKEIQRKLLRKYEIWFAVCKRVIRQYSDCVYDFEKSYKPIKAHIQLEYKMSKSDILNRFISWFDIQTNIIHTIHPIIALKETNYKTIITADLLHSELDQAEALYEYKHFNAAGTIAGIALERYLKTLCEINNITIGNKDTIVPLATELNKNKIPPFIGGTLLKSIIHLASIRNNCTHAKEEKIKPHEIRELIDKVKKITFMSL